MVSQKSKVETKTPAQIISELRDNNRTLAKEQAKWKVNYALAIKERDSLNRENLTLRQQRENIRKCLKPMHTIFQNFGEALAALAIAVSAPSYQDNGVIPPIVDALESDKTANNSKSNSNNESTLLNTSGGSNESSSSSENDESQNSAKKTNPNKSNRQEQKSFNKTLSTLIEDSAEWNETREEECSTLTLAVCKEVRVVLSPCKDIEQRLSNEMNKENLDDNIERNVVDDEKSTKYLGNKKNLGITVRSRAHRNVSKSPLAYSPKSTPSPSKRRSLIRSPLASSPKPAPSSSVSCNSSPKTGVPSLSSTIANFEDTFERDTEQASTSTSKTPNKTILSPGFTSRMREGGLTSTPYNTTPINRNDMKSLITTSPLTSNTRKKKKLDLENSPPPETMSSTRRARSARPNSLKEVSLRKKLRRN